MKDLSIVVPVYRSERTLNELVERISAELEGKYDFEIILVNDGSPDNSHAICKAIAQERKYVKFISFHKNFGQISAFMAGFNEVEGKLCLLMDDDLQNPPEEIHRLINTLREGDYDFVFGIPQKMEQSFFRRQVSGINNKMSKWLLKKPENISLSSFLIIRNDIVKQIIKYDGPYPYVAGLLFRVTNNGCNLIVQHAPRKFGKSNYNLRKLIRHWIAGSTNFSIIPLRISAIIGVCVSFVGFATVIYFIIQKIYLKNFLSGWVSLFGAVLIFSGVQLLALGVLGEYIGRMFMIINKSPQYSIKEKYNCKE